MLPPIGCRHTLFIQSKIIFPQQFKMFQGFIKSNYYLQEKRYISLVSRGIRDLIIDKKRLTL